MIPRLFEPQFKVVRVKFVYSVFNRHEIYFAYLQFYQAVH